MTESSASLLFPTLNEDHLQNLTTCGMVLELSPGEVLFTEGDEAYSFYVVLDGKIKITKQIGKEEIVVTVHQRGEFTGELSMLTGGVCQATARSMETSHVIKFDDFKELLKSCPQSIDLFVPALAERSKDLEVRLRQQEKLAALGKLSAGLAHELNNPAAAGRRAAKQLNSAVANLQKQMLSLRGKHFSAQHRQILAELQQQAISELQTDTELSPLERSDREDALADWLEEKEIDNAWEIASNLVTVGIEQSQLQTLADEMSCEAFTEALVWLAATLSMNGLVKDVEQSTIRISDLVGAIKNYTYMDRAKLQEVNVHEGLNNTLKILHHKIKYGVTVNKNYAAELPKISAYGSELNQVWTNLIDNAIDAMKGKGELIINTAIEDNCLLVEIIDNGEGIPTEIQPRIFEPFFTSKGVGEGSGLGLDITRRIVVQQHKGNIRFDSVPDHTRFQIRLPLKLSK